MQTQNPIVVTISRQLGSGGAYIGQRLAARFGFSYADRDILRVAAEKLNLAEEEAALVDETAPSFWQSILQGFEYGTLEVCFIPPLVVPDGTMLRQAEIDVIRKLAWSQNAVVVGRGSSYILQDHPRLLSVFLHANGEFRRQRIVEIYNVSPEQAEELIVKSDSTRKRYLRTFSSANWTDMTRYHVTLNTAEIGLAATEEALSAILMCRFGIEPVNPDA